MLLSGSILALGSVSAESAAPAADARAHPEPARDHSGKHAPPKASTARHVSDLKAAADYRDLGIADCPPLPASAPGWLRHQAADPCFQYRDLHAILDTSNHLIHDALAGPGRLTDCYYFVEKVETDADQPATVQQHGHAHPELARSLDFEPQTPASMQGPKSDKGKEGGAAKVAPDAAQSGERKSWIRSALSYPFSFFRKSTPVSQPAPAAPVQPTKAFSSFNTDPPIKLKAQGPEVRAVFHLGPNVCGHRGIVHGGLTAALMDEVSGAATFAATGGGNFTANLNINYLQPLRSAQYVMVRAQAVKQEGRKTWVNIAVEDGKGSVFARGTALYVKPKMLPPAVLAAATQ